MSDVRREPSARHETKETSMRKNTTRIGILATAGAGAAALALAGFALPANASDTASTWEDTTTSTSTSSSIDGFRAMVHDLIQANGTDTTAGNVGLDGGVINAPLVQGPLVGDVASGPILSGNDTPVASGNETANGNEVASGNEVSAPVGSGNDVSAPVEAPVGSGNDTSVDAPVGSGNDTGLDVGGIGADVRDLVDDVTGAIGLDLGR
jgi:hypothetical protein